jgi:hypothetical protein
MLVAGSNLEEHEIVEWMRAARTRRVIFVVFAIVGPAVALGLLVLIAVSPIPMSGAEMFGMIAKKIKGHPGATAYWTLFAGAMLWVVIGLIAAVQERRAGV